MEVAGTEEAATKTADDRELQLLTTLICSNVLL